MKKYATWAPGELLPYRYEWSGTSVTVSSLVTATGGPFDST